MVEIQNININDMVKTKAGYINVIKLGPKKQRESKNLASESELHRILMHLGGKTDEEMREQNENDYAVVPSYFTLDVGKNEKRYDKLINSKGELIIANMDYVLDEHGNKVLDGNNHYKLKKASQCKYVSAFCGAGHSRTQKNLFVQEDIFEKLNDILLCGMPKNLVYDTPSKWNAYYAMVTTDSTPVKYMPNIVVIDDYKKIIRQKVDIVEVSGSGDDKIYNPIGHKGMKHHKEPLPIILFDGAGLVTPQCALRWARELGVRSSKGKLYLPSCFQFRLIPGIKGEVMVFDLRQFAKERNVSKIIDCGGKEWDIFEDKIDVILTKSQFKFWKQYLDKDGNFDYCLWRDEFNKKCNGYQRTFNIVSYGVHSDDLREMTMLSYQPEQTVNFTDEEITLVEKPGLDIYQKITSNIGEFLKYRGIIKRNDETGEEMDNIDEYVPPYYIALLYNKKLFYDKYIRSKIDADIEKFRNNILSGKIFVKGNYQVFMPDLYGLAEWAFHDELEHEPVGLLRKPYHIYCNWWNDKNTEEVDIIRNPAVGMEHRIGHLQNNDELRKWFKYQKTGVVTGMYDTLALALNSADFDGDCVLTTNNKHLIKAVKREFRTGNGRLVLKKVINPSEDEKEKKGVLISDRAELMRVNQRSFKNSIGNVINRETDLWSMVHNYDEETVRKYIMIGVIVGSETIDFAKTGENAFFPEEILEFLSDKKRGYWMRYLPKHMADAVKEEKTVKREKLRKKTEDDIEKVRKFKDYDCNMNRLCHYAEKQITDIDSWNEYKANDTCRIFDHRRQLLRSDPSINKKIYRKIKLLQEEYQSISNIYRKECLKSKAHQRAAANKYRWFYNRCRMELLFLEPDINVLMDMLIKIYYGDMYNGSDFLDLEKDILWNAFPDEMIARCSEKEISVEIDYEKLENYHKKNVEYNKKQKDNRISKKNVTINSIDTKEQYKNHCVIMTTGDRDAVNALIDKAYKEKLVIRKDNAIKLKRILAMLVYLSRKIEDQDRQTPRWLEKRDNAPNEITDRTLEKLTDVSHKYMEAAFVVFENLGVIERNEKSVYGKIKFRVLFGYHDGKPWIETDDYNKAGTMIRDYYRKTGFRETHTRKVS